MKTFVQFLIEAKSKDPKQKTLPMNMPTQFDPKDPVEPYEFKYRPSWMDRKGKVKKDLNRIDRDEKDKNWGKGRDDGNNERKKEEDWKNLPQDFDISRFRSR